MGFDPLKIVNADTLEKVVLTRQIGDFLGRSEDQEKRAAIENVARALAQDMALQVREALAFELRTCNYLPHDLAARMASDVESVAGPFLSATTVFSDADLAGLIPHLEEHAHITLAKRKDIGNATCDALVNFGSETSVGYLVRNFDLAIAEPTLGNVVKRFPDRIELMEHMGARPDLPIAIAQKVMTKVSDKLRAIMQAKYDLTDEVVDTVMRSSLSAACWKVIEQASPQQIHAYVKDLRLQKRLTMDLVLDMLEKGSVEFLQSTLAYRSGFTLAVVRDMLQVEDMTMFVVLMQKSDISKADAQLILQELKKKTA